MTEIKSIIASLGMSQSEFARQLGIPLRTVQDWCGGAHDPAPWALKLIKSWAEVQKKEKEN